jgi:hypothetical protein
VHSAKENGQSNTNQRCRNACIKWLCRNERKEKAQKSLRSHWAVRILFWRSFYIWNCATDKMMFFAHRRRKKRWILPGVGMSDITKSSEEPEFVKEIRTEKQ